MRVEEFKKLKRKLGLSAKNCGQLFGATERTVFRWLSGQSSIMPGVAERVRSAARVELQRREQEEVV